MNEQDETPATVHAPGVSWREGRRAAEDGLDLHWQCWIPAKPIGVLVVIHGLAEHGGRYRETAEALAAKGWAVYAGDLRGHGRSSDVPGAGRVHVKRFTDYCLDVATFIAVARERHAELRLFL